MTDEVTLGAEELSTSMRWASLRDSEVGRSALHGTDDEIEIFPINLIVDHGSIVFTTATGTKLALADQHGGQPSRPTTSTSPAQRRGASCCAVRQR